MSRGEEIQLVATFFFCGRVELRSENRKKLSELYLTVTVVESFRVFFSPDHNQLAAGFESRSAGLLISILCQ
jgi:hypothetical protein